MIIIESTLGVKMDWMIYQGAMIPWAILLMIIDIQITIVHIGNIIRLMNKNKKAKFDLENPKF